MKTGKTVFMAILAIIFTLTFVNCDNGGGSKTSTDLGSGTRDAVTYTGTTDGGVTYTLKIEDGSGRAVLTPRANDKYTLTAGGKTSTGTVVSFIVGVISLKPLNSTVEFTASVSGGNIIILTGTITYTDDTTVEVPGVLTPDGKPDGKVYFRIARWEVDGEPEINSNTGIQLLLKDYFSGTLENGKYYTITISGNLDKVIDDFYLMFYQGEPWLDIINVGSWDSWGTISGSIPAGKVDQYFEILIRDDIDITQDQVFIHLAHGFKNPVTYKDGTITATISNFKMTINEFVEAPPALPPGGGPDPDNGGATPDPGDGNTTPPNKG